MQSSQQKLCDSTKSVLSISLLFEISEEMNNYSVFGWVYVRMQVSFFYVLCSSRAISTKPFKVASQKNAVQVSFIENSYAIAKDEV
ncbi:MAG: hypothetical protein ACI85I_002920 [Arenicella sp.]|jgi:hypothetical protein